MHQPRRIDCIHYEATGCGKCSHPKGRSFFGKLPCILTTNDTRVGSCRVQQTNISVSFKPPGSR